VCEENFGIRYEARFGDRRHQTHAGLAAKPSKQSAQGLLGIDAIPFRSAQVPIYRYARRLDDTLRHEPPRQL
jgi:hypothetical protein